MNLQSRLINHKLSYPAFFLLSTLLILVCYYQGVNGPFLFDDTPNILKNLALQINDLSFESLYNASMSGGAGILKRPVSMLTFALNHYFYGSEVASSYKLTNIVIHIFCFIATYWFIKLLLNYLELPYSSQKIKALALAVAILWAIHPFNLTSVLYVVQRMTSLSALFSLLTLSSYLYARIKQKHSFYIISFLLFTLAILSKENALLLPVFLVVIEVFRSIQRNSIQMPLKILSLLAAPGLIFICVYLFIDNNVLLRGYEVRQFNMLERLMTQSRVVFEYIQLSLLPNIMSMSIYHDDLKVSKSIVSPISTLLTAIFHITLISAAIFFRKKQTLVCFSIVMFYAAHSMESSILPLEMMHEHRNYFPLIFLILGTALIVCQIPKINNKILFTVALLLLSSLTYIRSQNWQSYPSLMIASSIKKPESISSAYDAGLWYYSESIKSQEKSITADNASKAIKLFSKVTQLSKSSVMGELGIIRLYDMVGQTLPEKHINIAIERLENHPITTSNSWSTLDFAQCNLNNHCNIPIDITESIVLAALSNPTMQVRPRSQAYSTLAVLMLRTGNLIKAKLYIENAIDTGHIEPGYENLHHHIEKALKATNENNSN